jgi:SAM-dependent methyltransferase
MPCDRQLSVNEIKRILKPGGFAYISVGGGPPFGYVDDSEWASIIGGFKVERESASREKWALVSPA